MLYQNTWIAKFFISLYLNCYYVSYRFPLHLIPPHLVPLPKGEETTLQFSLFYYNSEHTEPLVLTANKTLKAPSPLLWGEE